MRGVCHDCRERPDRVVASCMGASSLRQWFVVVVFSRRLSRRSCSARRASGDDGSAASRPLEVVGVRPVEVRWSSMRKEATGVRARSLGWLDFVGRWGGRALAPNLARRKSKHRSRTTRDPPLRSSPLRATPSTRPQPPARTDPRSHSAAFPPREHTAPPPRPASGRDFAPQQTWPLSPITPALRRWRGDSGRREV